MRQKLNEPKTRNEGRSKLKVDEQIVNKGRMSAWPKANSVKNKLSTKSQRRNSTCIKLKKL